MYDPNPTPAFVAPDVAPAPALDAPPTSAPADPMPTVVAPDAAPAPAATPPAATAPVPAIGALVRRTYDDPYVEAGITTVYGVVVAHGEDEGGALLSVAWLPELSPAMRPDDLDH